MVVFSRTFLKLTRLFIQFARYKHFYDHSLAGFIAEKKYCPEKFPTSWKEEIVSTWNPRKNALHRKNKFYVFQCVSRWSPNRFYVHSKTLRQTLKSKALATIQCVESTRFYNLSACINLSLNESTKTKIVDFLFTIQAFEIFVLTSSHSVVISSDVDKYEWKSS